jgi:hypothetical protein
MAKLRPTDIVDEVRSVLLGTNRGKGRQRKFITSYQVLARLEPSLRRRILVERGLPGRGANARHTAAHVIARAASMIHGVETAYLDPLGTSFVIGRRRVAAGYAVCAMFRIP